MKGLLIAFAVAVLSVAPPASAAPLLVFDGGKITGVKGVNVFGTLYDVTFVDGTCAQVFSGCDELSDFDFPVLDPLDLSTAIHAASQTLIEFNQLAPDLLFGCSDPRVCQFLVPYGLFSDNGLDGVLTVMGQNVDTSFDNVLFDQRIAFVNDTGDDRGAGDELVWADFRRVPEPATVVLTMAGFAALCACRWRRRT